MSKSANLTAAFALTGALVVASWSPAAQAAPGDLTVASLSASQAKALAASSARNQETALNMYSVMTDRFANGDPSNDTGGISGGPLQHGFDATKKQFYNGGDIKGLTDKLDYIKGLGMNAIWITPPYENDPVQILPNYTSASYHGYWITGFDTMDKHVGTPAEVKTFIAAAHKKGLKVIFDVVANHTADVFDYAQQEYTYRASDQYPYKDVNGNAFNPHDFATSSQFPQMKVEDMPYTPVQRQASDATKRSPAFLNDALNYHNRGDSTFAGESSQWGDFIGLDDVFTEKPAVVNGFKDIFKGYIKNYGVDGFRIDTYKHVNIEFWQQVMPDVERYAHTQGKKNFYVFGEVASPTAEEVSWWSTKGRSGSMLDFAFQGAIRKLLAENAPVSTLADLFAQDDLYTTKDFNAYNLATFVSNHDMGRMANMLRVDTPEQPDWALLRRLNVANAVLFFSRGNPIVYYGDEQGFVGNGNDTGARESLFASKVPEYAEETLLGTDRTGAQDNYGTNVPMYRQIQRIADVVNANPALKNGAQVTRHVDEGQGVFAMSRTDAGKGVEYVVAVNNGWTDKQVDIPTYSANMAFTQLYPAGSQTLYTDLNKRLSLTVPAMSVTVFKAAKAVAKSSSAPSVELTGMTPGATITDRWQVQARTSNQGGSNDQVTFVAKVGNAAWASIGTDDNPQWSVWFDPSGIAPGTPVTFRAIVTDNNGHRRVSDGIVQVVGETASVKAQQAPVDTPESLQPQQRGR
ncbi:alpha-amylase family glycosyl hydrolase [Micropruina sp.]|uniref:alpha-amylase family glycosyl hydrolase n=1 Tax=Micropruina sp. TaxID=2737536 RepID=UPI0039E2E84E